MGLKVILYFKLNNNSKKGHTLPLHPSLLADSSGSPGSKTESTFTENEVKLNKLQILLMCDRVTLLTIPEFWPLIIAVCFVLFFSIPGTAPGLLSSLRSVPVREVKSTRAGSHHGNRWAASGEHWQAPACCCWTLRPFCQNCAPCCRGESGDRPQVLLVDFVYFSLHNVCCKNNL